MVKIRIEIDVPAMTYIRAKSSLEVITKHMKHYVKDRYTPHPEWILRDDPIRYNNNEDVETHRIPTELFKIRDFDLLVGYVGNNNIKYGFHESFFTQRYAWYNKTNEAKAYNRLRQRLKEYIEILEMEG